MKPLTLTLRRQPGTWVDMSPLVPDRLAALGRGALRKLRLRVGRRLVLLPELFDIEAGDPASIRIRGGVPQLTRIGHAMAAGRIEVHGHAGQYLGQRMRGGSIAVRGDAGDRTAAGMAGGSIYISGNAGDHVGGSRPGATQGMSGGQIVVAGDAGTRLGDGMRRGTIIVLGNAGDFPGSRLLAGTLVVLGRAGRHPGYGMRRGTIILGRKPELLPTFRSCGRLELEFLRLFFRQVSRTDRRLATLRDLEPAAHRLAGDAAVGGVGELLVLS